MTEPFEIETEHVKKEEAGNRLLAYRDAIAPGRAEGKEADTDEH